MGVLECRIPVSKELAESMPRNPGLVKNLAVEVEETMREEAAKFAKALVGVPAMVEVVDRSGSALALPRSAHMVELVFRCHTT